MWLSKFWRLGLAVAVSFSLNGLGDEPIPRPKGTYVGVLRHETIKRDQLAKLDFITSREEEGVQHYTAILTIHYGGFTSGEYTSYHFDNVRFNLGTGKLFFNQTDSFITILGARLGGNLFEGKVQVKTKNPGGEYSLLLSNDKPVAPVYPLIEPIWGDYRGRCLSKIKDVEVDTALQLVTHRSSDGAGQTGDPFRSYKISGQLGEDQGEKCPGTNSRMCQWGTYKRGSYNVFMKQLKVMGTYRDLTCTTEPGGLQCNGCTFLTRVSPEMKNPALTPPLFKGSFEPPEGKAVFAGTDVTKIGGQYNGYLHHEYSGAYQRGGANIFTAQSEGPEGEETALRLSAAAHLTFGTDEDGETLTYPFKERAIPSPLVQMQFILAQLDEDVDALLQVTQLSNGVIKGNWFSQRFGRVGTFEFRKDGLPQIPAGAYVMEKVAGDYEGNQWDISIQAGPGKSEIKSENPFAPLVIGGWTILRGLTAKKLIDAGSYDFYTGKFGLEYDDVAFVGQRLSRRRLLLKRTKHVTMNEMRPLSLEPYRLLEEDLNLD